MSMKNKRVTLLSYWTSRYVLTLFIGLLIISLISALWIRHTTLEYRLEMMEFVADDMVDRITDIYVPEIVPEGEIPNFIDTQDRFRDITPITYLVNTDGNVISSSRPFTKSTPRTFNGLINGKEGITTYTSSDDHFGYYVVKRKLEIDGNVVGWVFVVESKANLTKVNQEYGQLAILVIALAVLGWIAIYFLSKRLARPIKQVAEAAKQVQEGNYEINLPDHIKEREVYELVSSFKEMAGRLEQLEKTRTVLLAGVTHELKTPVTSISALLQAVKDGIVTDQEADEFIQMALVETTKMKTMVGDLLAFNTFAVDAVPVQIGPYDVNRIINETVAQWEVIQEQENITIRQQLLDKKVITSVDLVRVQQIMTNLLTNAQQAIQGTGEISIMLTQKNDYVSITVQDTGAGIAKEDHPFIFERFFRGENKKYAIRGLGLGLPLSKMMAQSIGGDLNLLDSSENGTRFELLLRKKG